MRTTALPVCPARSRFGPPATTVVRGAHVGPVAQKAGGGERVPTHQHGAGEVRCRWCWSHSVSNQPSAIAVLCQSHMVLEQPGARATQF